MLSWTVGGYPGGNLELLSYSGKDLTEKRFGKNAAPIIIKAFDSFDRGFAEFPLHRTSQLYTAPQNFGPMNLLMLKPGGYTATMVGFPYDDLDAWRGGHFPEEIFESQFEKMCALWAQGLVLLSEAEKLIIPDQRQAFADLFNAAEATYCFLRSTCLQIQFVRRRGAADTQTLRKIVKEEISIAGRMLAVMQRDSRIGYEASNHYYFTANDLLEKVMNCEFIIDELENNPVLYGAENTGEKMSNQFPAILFEGIIAASLLGVSGVFLKCAHGISQGPLLIIVGLAITCTGAIWRLVTHESL